MELRGTERGGARYFHHGPGRGKQEKRVLINILSTNKKQPKTGEEQQMKKAAKTRNEGSSRDTLIRILAVPWACASGCCGHQGPCPPLPPHGPLLTVQQRVSPELTTQSQGPRGPARAATQTHGNPGMKSDALTAESPRFIY